MKPITKQLSEKKFAGLTDQQVLDVCERIAINVNMLATYCRAEAPLHEDEVATIFQMLDQMLCNIGALADLPTGGAVVGGMADWMVGASFHQQQRGGQQ